MGLHPWVAYAIMPIFALANAGVKLDPVALTSGVSIAVAMGLALGKPLGIFLSVSLLSEWVGPSSRVALIGRFSSEGLA
jgi:NhaA family Na+:H+ antiporter